MSVLHQVPKYHVIVADGDLNAKNEIVTTTDITTFSIKMDSSCYICRNNLIWLILSPHTVGKMVNCGLLSIQTAVKHS